MRSVGSTFEIEPVWDAAPGMVSLNLAPERVEFADFIHYGHGDLLAQQPVFFTMKTQTNLRIPDGGYAIASVQVPRDAGATGEDAVRLDQSKRVLVFVKATVFKVPLGRTERHNNAEKK